MSHALLPYHLMLLKSISIIQIIVGRSSALTDLYLSFASAKRFHLRVAFFCRHPCRSDQSKVRVKRCLLSAVLWLFFLLA